MVELVYALFLLSGIIKFFLLYLAGGLVFVDITLLLAIVLSGIYAVRFFKDFYAKSTFFIIEPSRSILLTVCAFYLWMLFSLIYTRSPAYCYTKLFMFLTIVVALAFPLLYRGLKPGRFFTLFVYIGSAVVFVYSVLIPDLYANYVAMAGEQDKEFVVKYLDVGYLSGIIILLLLFFSPRMNRLIKILLFGINLAALVISAARGPIVFFLIVLALKLAGLVVPLLKKKWQLGGKGIIAAVSAFGILGGGFYYVMGTYSALLERSVTRFFKLFDPETSSVAIRFSMFSFTVETILNNAVNFLFGLGIGSFGILYDGFDERQYPHNIILEIWFELGLVGVLLFVVMLLLYFKKMRSNFNSVLIFIFLLLNSFKSYSLVDSRIMFGLLSILLLYDIRLKRKNNGENKT